MVSASACCYGPYFVLCSCAVCRCCWAGKCPRRHSAAGTGRTAVWFQHLHDQMALLYAVWFVLWLCSGAAGLASGLRGKLLQALDTHCAASCAWFHHLYIVLTPSVCLVLCAGAAGLASALRGTVRQALDAYQTRAALHRSSRHSRHSSTSSGTLGSLRSALGAGPAAPAASPWQQQQQQLPSREARVSWAQIPLSPLGSSAIGVSSMPAGLGRSASTAAAAAGGGMVPGISRLSSVTAGVLGDGQRGPVAQAAAGGGAGSAAGSSRSAGPRTSKGRKSPQHISAAAAAGGGGAAAAALGQEPPAAGAAAPAAVPAAAGDAAAATAGSPAADSSGTAVTAASEVAAEAAAGGSSSVGPLGRLRSGLSPGRVSSGSSWSDFEAVGDETASAGGRQTHAEP